MEDPGFVPKHLVTFSGGICSYAAAKRVAQKHGTEQMILLFADTLIEDEDLYRFLDEASKNVGARLIRISEGIHPWQLFFDRRFIANNRVALCSRILKRELSDRWRNKFCRPFYTTCYVGYDAEELHRYKKLKTIVTDWRYEAPMTERPYMSRQEMLEWLAREGLRPPRLYDLGFAHNNCGGFCVRGGQGAFLHLLKTFPERYAYHEQMERRFRKVNALDVAILRHRSGPKNGRPLTLEELRLKYEEKNMSDIDCHDIGGCGCMSDE